MSQALKSLTKPQLIQRCEALVAELDSLRTINTAHQTLVISARERIAAAEAEYAGKQAPRMTSEQDEDAAQYHLSAEQLGHLTGRSVGYAPYTAQERAEWKARKIAALPPKPTYVKPTYQMPEWQVQRAADMAAKKEAARAIYGFTK